MNLIKKNLYLKFAAEEKAEKAEKDKKINGTNADKKEQAPKLKKGHEETDLKADTPEIKKKKLIKTGVSLLFLSAFLSIIGVFVYQAFIPGPTVLNVSALIATTSKDSKGSDYFYLKDDKISGYKKIILNDDIHVERQPGLANDYWAYANNGTLRFSFTKLSDGTYEIPGLIGDNAKKNISSGSSSASIIERNKKGYQAGFEFPAPIDIKQKLETVIFNEIIGFLPQIAKKTNIVVVPPTDTPSVANNYTVPISFSVSTYYIEENKPDSTEKELKVVNTEAIEKMLTFGNVNFTFNPPATPAKLLVSQKTNNSMPTIINSNNTPFYTINDEANFNRSAIIDDKDKPFIYISNWLGQASQSALFPPTPFNWLSLFSLLLPIILIVSMFAISFKLLKSQTGEGGANSIFGMGKSLAKISKSTTLFSDVAGINEEKFELSEVVDYLKNPEKYVEMGARTPKGVILYGPPGTGKTLLAKAVAGEAGVPFFEASGSSFEDMLVGVGAKRVRDLFKNARKVAPSIIFIDEIDSVASKRGKNDVVGGGGGIADQTINQLLAEMDGFNTSTGVIVIAATNRLDVLDDAILRPGRFDRHISVNLPDIKEREEILKIHSRNKKIGKAVSLADIARRTPGFSGAQLENVINEATLLAVRENKKIVSMDDLDEAIDRVIAGPAKKSRTISEEENRLVAYHEAGHALVGLYTDNAEVVEKITIIPRGNAAGYTMQTPKTKESNIKTKKELLQIIRMTLGGRAAEEIIYGADMITTGASNDFYKVTRTVKMMVMQLGMYPVGLTQFIASEGNQNQFMKDFSESKSREIDDQIEKIIREEYEEAKKIISENRFELDLIVETLILLETIIKDQIDYIHKYKKLPPDAVEQKRKNAMDSIISKKLKAEGNIGNETKAIEDLFENSDDFTIDLNDDEPDSKDKK